MLNTQSSKEFKFGRKKEALKELHNTCLVLTKVRQYLAVEESSSVVLNNILSNSCGLLRFVDMLVLVHVRNKQMDRVSFVILVKRDGGGGH